jgi:hypothetical protein
MSITAAGLFGLSMEKALIDTLGESLEAEDQEMTLVSDSYTPNFDTHDFHADLTDELTTSGQPGITSTEITLSGGTLTYDAADTVFPAVTVADAMASVGYTNVGSSATDQLMFLQDFGSSASASSADFTVQHDAAGIFTWDYTP